ncbi:Cro/CI family transcriptional regulator [Aquabacter sp. CN5-332]|uniref:transcriptional regulator n=1 Tax=Aquabacter sp. CN5-332 TaxID=3156608 RepID=UPI0032B47B14
MSELALSPTEEAIRLAGGPTELSRQIGISPQAISQWDLVPAKRVLVVENITGISRYALRPDIYGPAPSLHSQEMAA